MVCGSGAGNVLIHEEAGDDDLEAAGAMDKEPPGRPLRPLSTCFQDSTISPRSPQARTRGRAPSWRPAQAGGSQGLEGFGSVDHPETRVMKWIHRDPEHDE